MIGLCCLPGDGGIASRIDHTIETSRRSKTGVARSLGFDDRTPTEAEKREMKLVDKTAVVTGAGRGIGRAIAVKLASEGARVVVNDLDPGPAKETVELVQGTGGQAIAVSGSV